MRRPTAMALLGVAFAVLCWPFTMAGGFDSAGEPVVVRSGWFNVVWVDPSPGSHVPPRIEYSLTDDEGKLTRLVIEEELIQQLGGVRRLMGRRIEVTGQSVPDPHGAVRVMSMSIEQEKK